MSSNGPVRQRYAMATGSKAPTQQQPPGKAAPAPAPTQKK